MNERFFRTYPATRWCSCSQIPHFTDICRPLSGPPGLLASPEGLNYLSRQGLTQKLETATHLAWAMGGRHGTRNCDTWILPAHQVTPAMDMQA
ncbi:hypothetical protein [uncultured Desulfobacter sp.]|uniref:hypothetical protein n=1 Tax=uncultured Desulfobacter sp. TaxID=240139 RepID=UPI002AAC04AA|nr:hypothetical protein [uncultured Desulfobacter sp.]